MIQYSRCSIFSSQNKRDTYQVTEPLNFKNQQYLIYECRNKHYSARNYLYYITAADVFCMFFFVRSIINFRVIRTILWAFPTYFCTKVAVGFKLHSDHMVTSIHLKDNGTQLILTHLSGKKLTVNISDIEKPSQHFFRESLEAYGMLGLELYPLQIKERKHMLDKEGIIDNKEVFKAVCNGFDIEFVNSKGGSGKNDKNDKNDPNNIIDI